jgi:undecaprenyl pyrophosphate phosphatase UppP
MWGALLVTVVGYVSLVALVKALKGRWFWLFGPYCVTAGLLTLCFL